MTTTFGVLSYFEAKQNRKLPEKKEDAIIDLLKDEHIPFRDPLVMHQVISELECQGKDIFLIGDIHGCLEELKELLTKCELLREGIVREDAIVILCGDLVTKGPLNLETLRFIQDAGLFAVRGNQDDKCILRYVNKQNGVAYAPKSLWMEGLTSTDIDFLLDLPYSISIPSIKTIIVHAGMIPDIPVQEQNRFVLTYMRTLLKKNGTLVPSCQGMNKNGGQQWAELWQGPDHVYFGHDARRGLQKWEFATGLDTGCVYGKTLTGIFISGHQKGKIVSVEAKCTYWDTKEKQERS